jgi:hypothetical protein
MKINILTMFRFFNPNNPWREAFLQPFSLFILHITSKDYFWQKPIECSSCNSTLHSIIIIIIIIIICKTALSEPQPSLEDYAKFVYSTVFTSLDFTTIIFSHSKVISLASNPQPEGPGLYIYVPQ